MRQWQQHELTAVNHSADFLCPHCEAGGFEVVAMERHLAEEQQTDCALVMRCLGCLEVFWHWVGAESLSDAEPGLAAVPAAGHTPSAG